jgi:hypothetical protein
VAPRNQNSLTIAVHKLHSIEQFETDPYRGVAPANGLLLEGALATARGADPAPAALAAKYGAGRKH